ncbi:MAG: YchJ family protein [Oligoflexus sp.]
MTPDICPCGSKKPFNSCCGLYVQQGIAAPDPEALMRSRYTAFYLNDIEYLKKTWHPETCPEELDAEEPSKWVGLEILDSSLEGEEEGEVEFRAYLIFDNKLETLHEISDFCKLDGKWVYHSGEFRNEGQKAKKIANNAPCPCGSGKKFRQCHYE